MLCMNCHEPLHLDNSLVEKYPEWQTLSRPGQLKKTTSVKAASVSTSLDPSEPTGCAEGYSLIAKPDESSAVDGTRSLSNTILASGTLSAIICNDLTAIDHPMCQECADKLLDGMDQQLDLLEEESREYTTLLENLTMCEDQLHLPSLKVELEKAQEEEAELLAELERLALNENELNLKLEEGEKKLKEEKHKEETLWKKYRDLSRQCIELELENQSINNQLRYAQDQLNKLSKTNVFNLTFHIWYNGHFGTINNLRLGRLPQVVVDWNEINAAWGQTCFLLYCLAKKIDFRFQRYELVPMGNYSFVKCLDDNKELPLYCSGGYKFFWDTKFDAAMVAYLDCLQQFKEAIETGDGQFCIPYRIQKDKIITEEGGIQNEFSVKIQFNSEERWTKAMKFMLTNLKWALAWVSSQYCQ